MDWSQKRKIFYALGFTAIIILLAAYPVYKLTYKAPTCFDGSQNGGETGVDCGGGCALICIADAKPPHAVWAKAFQINGVYDVAAYIENMNANAGIKSARYTIRILGSEGKVLAEKVGTMEIAPAGRALIFETGVAVSGVPDRVEVSFDSKNLATWTKATTAPSPVVTKNQTLKNVDTKPRFDAVIVNTDPVNEVANLSLSAIVYDSLRRPVAVSKTYVDFIPKGGEQDIFFTWPSRFTKYSKGDVCRTPVDTIFLIDHSSSMDVGRKAPPEPLEIVKNVVKEHLALMSATDKVGIISFANTSSSPVDFELSTNREEASTTISSIIVKKDAPVGSNLGDALRSALVELQSPRHAMNAKKVIVAITDGNTIIPTDPVIHTNKKMYAEGYATTAAEEAVSSGVKIYVIGVGKNINEIFLKENISGDPSHYFSSPTPEALRSIYRDTSEVPCPPESFITEIVVTPRAIFAE